MTRSALVSLVALSLASSIAWAEPASAVAVQSVTYDTVDAVETESGTSVSITGIVAGQASATTLKYRVELGGTSGDAGGARCDRLALLAMSKPGKYQLSLTKLEGINMFTCKLALRAP